MRWWRTHSFHDDEEAEGHGWSPTPPRSWPQSRPTKRELEANGCRTSEGLLFGVAANHRTPFVEDLCEGGTVTVFLAVTVSCPATCRSVRGSLVCFLPRWMHTLPTQCST